MIPLEIFDFLPERCKVFRVKAAMDGDGLATAVSFTRLDEALPFFPEPAKGILKWAPLLEEIRAKHQLPGLVEARSGACADFDGADSLDLDD